MCESTIRAASPVVTLINVFTVEPGNQDRLIEAWQRSTDEVIRHLPGCVSAISTPASTAPRSSTTPNGKPGVVHQHARRPCGCPPRAGVCCGSGRAGHRAPRGPYAQRTARLGTARLLRQACFYPLAASTVRRSALLFLVMGVSASALTRHDANDNDTHCPPGSWKEPGCTTTRTTTASFNSQDKWMS